MAKILTNKLPIIWSDDQNAIFHHIKYGRGHSLTNACAGSGKTLVTLQGLEYTPKNARILFLAFNRAIKNELKNRAPKHVQVDTYHAFGFAAIKSAFGRGIDLDKNRTDKILEKIVPEKYRFELIPQLKNLVYWSKQNNVSKPEEILQLGFHHGMLIYNPDVFLDYINSYVIPAIEMSKQVTDTIDYEDMCWLPVVLNLKVPQYDFVGVDEAQDSNSGQLVLLSKALRPAGRLLATGDTFQSICGYRGASVDAIDTIVKKFKPTSFPMRTTYRCSLAVVEKAKTIVPDIRAAPNAILGSCDDYSYNNFLDDASPGDFVLCRTSAALVEPCFTLIQEGVKASILGSEIGLKLIDLIKSTKADSMKQLFCKLEEFRENQIVIGEELGNSDIAQKAVDNIDAIYALSTGTNTIELLYKKIRTMYSDEKKDIVFSTIHKAKGLEAENVWVLRPDLLPHPMSKLAWEIQQESNLEYVAYTRAKNSLNIVKDGYPKSTRTTIKKNTGNEAILNTPIALPDNNDY
jgi:superfamily I DNA/RNA helicase